jgi:adenine deaminase
LNHEAAKTVRYGQTSEADALKMITINPAMQLGIADKVGSLEVGKQGDIAIWSGHPLSIYSKVEQTYIDGTKYFDLANDPVDMRIDISSDDNYEESFTTGFIKGREADACMSDVFQLIQE